MLKNCNVLKEDYKHANSTWNKFNLKVIKQTIELITDTDMYLFIERDKEGECHLLDIDMLRQIIGTLELLILIKSHL